MEQVKQINVKNRKLYIHGSRVILDEFNPENLKVDIKSFEDVSIVYVWYLSPNDLFNPLYLLIPNVNGYIIEYCGNRYLKIASTDGNKDVLKKYGSVWDKITSHMDAKCYKYADNFMKIKVGSDDDLPLNRLLNFNLLTIFVKFIYELYGNCYAEVFVDSCCINEIDMG